MIAANRPIQRPRDARLLVVDGEGRMAHVPRARFVDFLRRGDLVIANDAATLPASLHGVHTPSGAEIEVRLVWRASLDAADVHTFSAVVFGAGDFRTRTEDRPLPPLLKRGDRLLLGPLSATIDAVLDHRRLVSLRFAGSPQSVWEGLARHGRPIQYAHMTTPLAMWDVWTPIAGPPVAFEPPSASFALDWGSIRTMRERGIAFATVTLAAGLSSTGDPELDRRLPFDEPYRIPRTTASAIDRVKREGGRIIAIGTTVVRALEHAAARDDVVRAGDGVADQRIGPDSRLRIVDAILSGTHEPGGSHYQVLRAFMDDATLAAANAALETMGYRTHEFGDSVLVEKKIEAARITISAAREELMQRITRAALMVAIALFPAVVFAQAPKAATYITDEEIKTVNSQPGIDRTIRVVDIGNEHLSIGIIHRGPSGGAGRGTAAAGGAGRAAPAPAEPCGEQASTPPADATAGGITHDSQTEGYLIVSGGGTLVTGGRIVNGRKSAPESDVTRILNGPSCSGAIAGTDVVKRVVKTGDIIIIPAGVPHGWTNITDHVDYLSFRPSDHVLDAGYVHPSIKK